jgi:hypothetical protein
MNAPTSPRGATVPPGDTSRTTTDLVKTVGQFVAAVTAVAGTIYLVGTLVLLARLWWTRGLSGVSQVSQLSKDVLVSLGLEVLLAPLGIGVGYAIFRALRPKEKPATPDDDRHSVRLKRVVPLLAVPALGAWIIDAATEHAALPIWADILIGIGICALALGLGEITVRTWEALGQGYVDEAERETNPPDTEQEADPPATERETNPPDTEQEADPPETKRDKLAKTKWNSMGAVLVVSFLFAAANVPSWTFVAASVPLGHAIVCPDPGRPVRGYLIGEGGSRTYLAPYENHRIVSFPNDHVVRVIAGRNGELGNPPCPKAPMDTTKSPDINLHVTTPRPPAPVIRVHVDSDDG